MMVFGGAAIWAGMTAPNAAAAWMFWGGAAFFFGLSVLGGYMFARHATIFVEQGTLVVRSPFSIRRLALAEVDHLEVRLRQTRGGITYRELVVVDQAGVSRANILADDFSDSRIAHFAKAAGLRIQLA